MKPHATKYLLLISLPIIIMVGVYMLRLPNVKQLRDQVAKNNDYSVETPLRNTYDSLCNIENQKGILFPVKKASYAKLTKNDLWKKSRKVEGKNLTQLLEFLNDSTNYRWGELGTPEIHYYIGFYDQDDHCVGLTTIDIQGMAYSYPATARMKWGMLKEMTYIRRVLSE